MKRYLLYRLLAIHVMCIFLIPLLTAQTDTLYYLNSSFETSEDQATWTSMPAHPTVKWKYDTGGDQYPLSAKSGILNAWLFWPDPGTSVYRTLQSQAIDLSVAERPELTFWHAQAKSFLGQDELTILFKAGSAADWDTIIAYTERMDDWTGEIYNINEIDEKYLCEDFYLGFLGMANGGHGVCVDSVVIKEKAIIDKFVKSIAYTDVEHEVIASKTEQLPLIRVEIEIMGNNGISDLNSVAFQLNSGSESYFKSSGFKLFHTISSSYKSKENGHPTQVGSAVSISGGEVEFTGLSHELELGKNYLWLTADLANDIEHNSQFTFGVDAQSLSYNDTLLPVSSISNVVTATVEEAVFYDNYSTTTGWDLEGDFEIAIPEGKLIGTKSKDPGFAYSGTKVLGTDLTDDGAYPDTINGTNIYHATSPMINLRYYNNIKIYMRKWIDFNPIDRASMSVSVNGGKSWTTIWQSYIDHPTASSYWDELLFSDIANTLLSRNDSVQFRLSVLDTDAQVGDSRAGFNMDNFTILGNHLAKDLAITEIHSPFDDCIGFYNDTVKVTIRNFAEESTPAMIPVYFGLWGVDSTLVYDTIYSSIGIDDSIVFTFSKLANFPQGDIYDKFVIGVALDGDEDISNDTMTKPLFIRDTYIPPSTEDFEYKGGIWLPSEGSTWLCKEPEGGSIPKLPDSPNSWILSPYGNYENSDTAYIESNCYDLSFVRRHIIELDYWLDSEEGKDGAAVEYSIDDGENWTLVNHTALSTYWGWYDSPVDALGHNGWSGISGDWLTVKELLPESLSTEVKVKFRMKWASDDDNNGRGLAFDNFKLYPAPVDVGVSSISVPKDTCQYTYPDELSIWVTNFGYNDLNTNDTIILGYDFESEPAVIDTFSLASDLIPGDSVLHVMPTSFDVNTPGTYQIKAYTLIEDDPFFYGTNNDTLIKSFEIWQSPITGLVDTISSRRPDTVLIEPIFDPDYSYLWGDNSTTPVYDVEDPGMYYLTVTEIVHGCETYDSIYIEFLFNDVSVDSIIWPQSSCELTNAENVQLQVRNTGTDSLIIGDKIMLYYELNSNPVVKDSIVLETRLLSGAAKWFTFESRTEDMSAIGDYNLKTYCYFGGDTIPENDTIERTISVYGYPDLDLGNDTIIDGLSYYIDVDPTFASYLWNDGNENGSRLIDTSGIYWLDVVDVHGCPASDTIDIWFRIHDIRPVMLVSPANACNRTGSEPIILRIQNYGSDTLTSSNNIAVSFKYESQPRVNANVTVSELLPGQYYDHTFVSESVDLTPLGDYDFNLTAVTAGDMRIENDTLDWVVSTLENPIIDLGVEEDSVYKVAEMLLNAGYGENYTYLWHDNSTEQTYTVTDVTNVEVFVLDTVTGCYGGDTVTVHLDILDYVIASIDIDENACSGDYEDVEVLILNNGNQPRTYAFITLVYRRGGDYLFTEEFENIGTWIDNTSKIHTTQQTIPLNDLGSDNISITISSEGDLRPENDEFNLPIDVIPSPDVNFGGESLEVEFPYTLDAGSGHASYLWSDGSTESTYTATQAGTYSVTVTGTNGCQTVRSVYLDTDLAVSSIAADEWNIQYYPNPANEYITVEAEFERPGEYILELFNAQNSILMMRRIENKEFNEDLYIGDLPAGLYFIRIRNHEAYHISKLVIR